jgi:hypothetical protein
MLRRVEAVIGLATAAAGIVGSLYAAFAPAYRYVGSTVSSGGSVSLVEGSAGLAQRGLGPPATIYLVAMLLTAVGLAACACLHSGWRRRTALPLMWLLTAVLWAGVALGAASLGILLLPAALLAAVTSVTGSLAAAGRVP